MPTPYPTEFRRDVIAVARQGDQLVAKVARSFGVSKSCLNRWVRIAGREDGRVDRSCPAQGGDLESENREPRTRTRQLEQENEILRRATAYFARDTLPKPGEPVVHAGADLQQPRPQARLEPQTRPAGARRPGRATVHRRPPNRLWLTDITEHPTGEGKLYLCPVEDACPNRIVGHSMAERMTAQRAVFAP